MLKVKTRFNTLRMVAGQKEPITMDVTVSNNGQKEELVSVIVKTPFSLGFDKVGLMREKRARLDYIKPGEEKSVHFVLYGKGTTQPGTIEMEVKAQSHPERYDRVEQTYIDNVSIRVIER